VHQRVTVWKKRDISILYIAKQKQHQIHQPLLEINTHRFQRKGRKDPCSKVNEIKGITITLPRGELPWDAWNRWRRSCCIIIIFIKQSIDVLRVSVSMKEDPLAPAPAKLLSRKRDRPTRAGP
jgi:hypothetical protein